MNCPNCQSTSHGVIESRKRSNTEIRRRRECTDCAWRWTTIEVTADELSTLRWVGKKYSELRLMIEDEL